MQTSVKTLMALTLVAMTLTLTACGGSKTTNNVQTTTVGQELEALEVAYAKGLMTEKEYETQRKRILKSK